jgi:hypothetical protein
MLDSNCRRRLIIIDARQPLGVKVGFQDEDCLLNHLNPLIIAIPLTNPGAMNHPGTCGTTAK